MFFRLCTALFIITFCVLPLRLLADSSEVVVTVGSGVQVRLNEILEKEPEGVKDGESLPRYRIRSLVIHRGGELLVDEDAVLTVTNLLIIYPGGSLLTDGHDLEVHARRFDAVRGNDSRREKLLPPRETTALPRWKKVLGTVDSSPLFDAPHSLKREKARDGAAPSSRHAGPSQADKRGWDGESG
ncbi:MAG: hypothetical protein HY391_04700, partial [Deltaproteobacteria bacterium]|nr:hypothetical protein [Deltaproteobacteria bacterium]